MGGTGYELGFLGWRWWEAFVCVFDQDFRTFFILEKVDLSIPYSRVFSVEIYYKDGFYFSSCQKKA